MTIDILDAICIHTLIIALCKLNLSMKESRTFKTIFPWLILKNIGELLYSEVFGARAVSRLLYSSFA
jgi:hypothetical protein